MPETQISYDMAGNRTSTLPVRDTCHVHHNTTIVTMRYFSIFAGTCSWSEMANTLTYNGRQNAATSVAACQQACISTTDCNGIDWDSTKASGQQCFLSGPWITGWNVGSATGVTHYNYTCGGGGGGKSSTSLCNCKSQSCGLFRIEKEHAEEVIGQNSIS